MSDTNNSSLFIFFILTLFAEIIGTIGGFGSSLFFVSTAQFLYDFNTVLALTGLLHIFSNVSKLFFFRKTIEWKLVLWLGVSSFLLAIAGSYLTGVVEFKYAKLLLGLFLISVSMLFFLRPHFEITPTKRNSILSGAAAGFLAGFIGTGGAIRGLALAAFHLERNLFVGTSAAIDFGVDLSRTFIYLEQGFLDSELFMNVPFMIVAAFVGSFLGKRFLSKIKQETFQKIVLVLVFIMGITLLTEQLLPI
ncbi:MAG TPA: sulfite exporter TauE/SafE family protein [Cyclobacteriaceae bacterium]|nr:sulfite exporter TauE/SafE family protein [Cyclobacteriaceae bacterium]